MKLRLLSIPSLVETVRRFPLPLACGAAAFFVLPDLRYGFLTSHSKDPALSSLSAILFVGVFFHTAFALIPARTRRARALFAAAGVAVHLAYGVWVFALPNTAVAWPVAFGVAIGLLLIAVLPFLRSRDDLSFWQFNRTVWQGVGIALAAGLLLAGGVSIGMKGLDQLFGIDLSRPYYRDVWTFVFYLVVPLHALSFVPKNTHFPAQDCRMPGPLSAIVNGIMAPLALAYMLILYAYFIKIGFSGELPNGVLAHLVTGFGGFGMVTYLVGWPLREAGGGPLRLFYKIFLPAMAVPVALQAAAIYQRVDAFGLTENRVAIIVATLWFALVLAARLFGRLRLKAIPALLALLLALVAAGPFSAYRLTILDQTNRMDTILARHGMLAGDRIVPAAAELPAEDRYKLGSIVTFLVKRGATEDMMRRLRLDTGRPYAHEIIRAMGFVSVSKWSLQNPITQSNLKVGKLPNVISTEGYDILFQSRSFKIDGKPDKNLSLDWKSPSAMQAAYADGKITYTVAGMGQVTLDVFTALAAAAPKEEKDRVRVLFVEGENDHFRVRAYLSANLWKWVHREKPGEFADLRLQRVSFVTLFAKKDSP